MQGGIQGAPGPGTVNSVIYSPDIPVIFTSLLLKTGVETGVIYLGKIPLVEGG